RGYILCSPPGWPSRISGAGADAGVHRMPGISPTASSSLTLVGEVPEERTGREPGPRRDLRHGGLGEALLKEEIERGLLEPFSGTGRPSPHATNSSDDMSCRAMRLSAFELLHGMDREAAPTWRWPPAPSSWSRSKGLPGPPRRRSRSASKIRRIHSRALDKCR